MQIEDYYSELKDLFITLCKIPAPSEHEDERLGFIANWYAENGLLNFEIDSIGNVLYYFGVKGFNQVHVFTAHVDTVFSSDTELVPRIENDTLYCPGSGDNTANLAIMMMTVKYLTEIGFEPSQGVIFAADICEEGLGNLKGINAILEAYSGRIEDVVSLDLAYGTIINEAVGSKRYELNVSAKGGHAYHDFGNSSAIAVAAQMISDIYRQKMPDEDSISYNVGLISGGTGVNVIAQNARFLYEIRAKKAKDLSFLDENLTEILIDHNNENVKIECSLIGERPCGADYDDNKKQFLQDRVIAAYNSSGWKDAGYGSDYSIISGSTDCNASLAKGIPSICFGLAYSEGHHTLNEFTRLDSLLPGMKTLVNFVLDE